MKSATAAKPGSLLKVANRAQVWAEHQSSLSQQYRARAEECRIRAQAFRDPKARARMLDVAAEYERKAKQAEASEFKNLSTSSAGTCSSCVRG